jgi:hypothetical protein
MLGAGTGVVAGGGVAGVAATVVLLPVLLAAGADVVGLLVPQPAAKARLKRIPARHARRRSVFNNEFPTPALTQSR